MQELIDLFGEARLMLASSFGIGNLFGAAANRSGFCLRAATVDLTEWRLAPAREPLACSGSTCRPMERYLVGGILLGFGSMLAGGCTVGAGLTGGSILALTEWVAALFMWIGAMATHLIIQHGPTLKPV